MSDSRFPPEMWAEFSSSLWPQMEANWSNEFNSEFNTAHPNIFKVIDRLTQLQYETQIKARSHVYKPKSAKKQELIENIIHEFSSHSITTWLI